MSSVSLSVFTVAERGSPVSRAISPNTSPRRQRGNRALPAILVGQQHRHAAGEDQEQRDPRITPMHHDLPRPNRVPLQLLRRSAAGHQAARRSNKAVLPISLRMSGDVSMPSRSARDMSESQSHTPGVPAPIVAERGRSGTPLWPGASHRYLNRNQPPRRGIFPSARRIRREHCGYVDDSAGLVATWLAARGGSNQLYTGSDRERLSASQRRCACT